ncbi:MAG TPA: hypothetical protein P5548_04070 [Candidatus Moranbacteria bacterium]|nr:hypothetical protein [Candidatus Moranbacteria bacterium]
MESFNRKIREISENNANTAHAIIMYNEKMAMLLVAAREVNDDGKSYKIWPKFSSLEEAKSKVKEFGENVELTCIREGEMPTDPEILLCNLFLLHFSQK